MFSSPWQVLPGLFLLGIYRGLREKKKMTTVAQGAKKLVAVMQENGGAIPIDFAREVLESEGLSGKNLEFSMVHGQAARRRWWRRSEDKERLELIEPAGAGPGPGPGSPAGAGPGSAESPTPAALASPEDRVRATAVQLGISPRSWRGLLPLTAPTST